MVAGFVTLHYKAVQEETGRNKQGRQRNKENKGRELGRRRGESNEAHTREEERGRDRKAPPQTKGEREERAAKEEEIKVKSPEEEVLEECK